MSRFVSRPSAEARKARRELARELADYTAAERTDLTLLAADSPAGAEIVELLREHATARLLRVA